MNIKAIEAIVNATDLVAEHAADSKTDLMLCINWADNKVEFFGEHNGSAYSYTAAEWHGHEINIGLPKVDARDIKIMLQGLLPDIEELAEDYDSEWDGSNHVATWRDQDARDEFQHRLERKIDELEHSPPVVCDANDYFSTVDADELKITAHTSDKELEKMAEEHEEEALGEGFVLYGAEDCLTAIRDDLVEELELKDELEE